MRLLRLGDVLSEVDRAVAVHADRLYPMLGVRSFSRGAFGAGRLRGSETAYSRLRRVRAGDVVYPKLMAWEQAFAIVPEDLDGSYVSPEFCTFEVDQSKVSIRYIANLLAWSEFAASLASPGTNVRRRRLQPASFLNALCPVPDLEEQRAIAGRLDARETVARRISDAGLARLQLEGVLRERLIYGDLAEYAATKTQLHEVLSETVDAKAVVDGRNYRTAGIRNRGRGLFAGPVLSRDSTKYRSLRRLHAGQVMYSKLKAFEGAISVVPEAYDGFFTSHEFPTFEVRSARVDAEYLRSVIVTRRFTELLAGGSKGVGARRERLSQDAFLSLEVPLPSMEGQRRIVRRLDALRQVSELSARQQALAQALPQAARNEVFSKLV